MISLTGDWSGRIVGTNNADIFVEINHLDSKLSGTLRINDPLAGVSVYGFTGAIDAGGMMTLEMEPTGDSRLPNAQTAFVNGHRLLITLPSGLGRVTASAKVVSNDRIEGKWTSSIGTGGTLWIARATAIVETASQFSGTISENVVFVMMPISDADHFLEDSLGAIKRAAAKNGLQAVRVDEIEHSGKITEVVLAKLRTCRFLVCDVTNERPNVYYELGYAHGLEKDVILVARLGTSVHFDVKDYNVIFYKSFADLEARVDRRIADAIGSSE